MIMEAEKRFDQIDEQLAEITRLLRGRHMEPGLVDEVRMLKRAYNRLVACGSFLAVVIITQAVDWIRVMVQGR